MNPEENKAKRCLFGPPDHQQLQADLQKELNKDAQEMNEKWNFDFHRGEPLRGGKFEWEPVEAAKEKSETSEESVSAAPTGGIRKLGNTQKNNKNKITKHHRKTSPDFTGYVFVL